MKRFKEYISETKLIVKAKVPDIKDFIDGTYKTNKDGTIYVDGDINIPFIGLKLIPWNIKRISGNFDCHDNNIESLGNLEYVGGSLWCQDNRIKSLENLKRVNGDFFCNGNYLTSFGNLKYVGGILVCGNNTKIFSEKEIRKTIEVKGDIDV